MTALFKEDLIHILNNTHELWEELRNKNIFLTGGTGFIGKWLLESFLFINKKQDLNSKCLVLTRDKDKFSKACPHLAADRSIEFLQGDITTFSFPEREFAFIIHAAIESNDSLILFDKCIQGTRRVLEFAKLCHAQKVLFTSSGAVYGKQPSQLLHIPEEYQGGPDPMEVKSSYGLAKKVSEFYCNECATRTGIEIKIARCFAFVGPHLPLRSNYAIGNFIYDVLKNQIINILGDGTPRRSYLYTSDLAIWLWTILFKGQSSYPYNVGSDQDLSILEVAEKVKNLVNPSTEITVHSVHDKKEIERYVPSVQRAFTGLNLKETITLDEAIIKTVRWNKTVNQKL